MKIKVRHLLPFILMPTLLWANDEPPEEPPWYEFELIIYANPGAAKNSDESWSSNPGLPSRLNTIPLLYKTVMEREAEAETFEMSQLPEPQEQPVIETVQEPPKTGQEPLLTVSNQLNDLPTTSHDQKEGVGNTFEMPIAYQQLPDEQLQLEEIYQKLIATKGRLEPLVHMAWRQQVEPPESAQTLYLLLPTDEAEQTPGLPDQSELSQLEGRIKISVKRYLHVDFDLVLRRLTTPTTTNEATLTALSPSYQAYRMQAHRRMRSKELHYIDHPLMGILIIARRYEIPDPVNESAPLEESEAIESIDKALQTGPAQLE